MWEYCMYFPFFVPQTGSKRSAAQPQTIYSEFPYIKRKWIEQVGLSAQCKVFNGMNLTTKFLRCGHGCGQTKSAAEMPNFSGNKSHYFP